MVDRNSAQYTGFSSLSDQQRKVTANPLLGDLYVTGNTDVAPRKFIMDDTGAQVLNPNYDSYMASKPKRTTTAGATSSGFLPVGTSGGSSGGISTGTTMAPSGGLLSQPSGFSVNTTYTGANVDPVTREVKADELASNQLNKLLSKDSPLSQRATTAGMQYGNSRGLLDSSIAGEAAYGAWVDRATPIAMDDAGKYTNVEDRNMDARNEFGLADKKFGFDLTLQKNDLGWKSGENALDRTLTRTENAADRSLTKSEGAANRSNSVTLQGMSDAAAMNRLTAGNEFTAGENALNRAQDLDVLGKQQEFTAGQNQAGWDFQQSMQDDQQSFTAQQTEEAFANRLEEIDVMAEKDAEARLDTHLNSLEELGYRFELDQKNLPKTYAANLMGYTNQSMAAILGDPNLEPEAKTKAVNNLIGYTNDMLAYGETLYGTDIPSFGTPSSESVANKEYSGEIFDPVAAPPTGRNQIYA